MMDKLADLRDEGKSIDEVRAWAEENKTRMHHFVATTDLTFLIKGGRLSKTDGLEYSEKCYASHSACLEDA